jgi:hypothetical protein
MAFSTIFNASVLQVSLGDLRHLTFAAPGYADISSEALSVIFSLIKALKITDSQEAGD